MFHKVFIGSLSATILALFLLVTNTKTNGATRLKNVLSQSSPNNYTLRNFQVLRTSKCAQCPSQRSQPMTKSLYTRSNLVVDRTPISQLYRASGSENQCETFKSLVEKLRNCGWGKVLVMMSAYTGKTPLKNNRGGNKNNVMRCTKRSQKTQKLTGHLGLNLIKYVFDQSFHAFQNVSAPVQPLVVHNGTTDSGESIDSVVLRAYNQSKIRNVLWISDKPWEIMGPAEQAFEQLNRDRKTLMLHKTRFVIIYVDSSSLASDVPCQQPHLQRDADMLNTATSFYHQCVVKHIQTMLTKSPFDNVLLIIFSASPSHDSSSVQYCLTNPQTLMWRGGIEKFREFQSVTHHNKYTTTENYPTLHSQLFRDEEARHQAERECQLFPNIRYGMNGRHLVALAKSDPPLLRPNKLGTGYEGFLVNVTDALSRSMNFTYTLTPGPSSSIEIPLAVMEKQIMNGEADFLAKIYYTSSSLVYNFSVTHPLIVANMCGVYLAKDEQYQFINVFSMYPVKVYCIILIAFFAFLGLYLLVRRLSDWLYGTKKKVVDFRRHTPPPSTEPNMCRARQPAVSMTGKRNEVIERNLTVQDLIQKDGNSRGLHAHPPRKAGRERCRWYDGKLVRILSRLDKWTENMKACLKELLDSTLQLFGSLLGQDVIPRPLHFSARLFLFSWSVTVLFAFAFLKSDMTVEMVMMKPTTPPLRSFNEMMSSGNYRWGHFNSSFLSVMKLSRTDPLKALYNGITHFKKRDPSVISDGKWSLVKKVAEDDHFVGIVDSFFVESLRMYDNADNLRVIRETLGTNGLSLSLPPHSELRDLMSEHIMRLQETGILRRFWVNDDKFHQVFTRKYYRNRDMRTNVNTYGIDMTINWLQAVTIFKFCPFCILCAVIVLVLEIFVSKWSPQNI